VSHCNAATTSPPGGASTAPYLQGTHPCIDTRGSTTAAPPSPVPRPASTDTDHSRQHLSKNPRSPEYTNEQPGTTSIPSAPAKHEGVVLLPEGMPFDPTSALFPSSVEALAIVRSEPRAVPCGITPPCVRESKSALYEPAPWRIGCDQRAGTIGRGPSVRGAASSASSCEHASLAVDIQVSRGGHWLLDPDIDSEPVLPPLADSDREPAFTDAPAAAGAAAGVGNLGAHTANPTVARMTAGANGRPSESKLGSES